MSYIKHSFSYMPKGIIDDESTRTWSGSGLVPSGNKPFPEPIATLIYVTMWRH